MSALRRVLGEATLGRRLVRRINASIWMTRVRRAARTMRRRFRHSVVDVRIRRADLPEQNSQAVYPAHARPSGSRRAAQYRAEGRAEGA